MTDAVSSEETVTVRLSVDEHGEAYDVAERLSIGFNAHLGYVDGGYGGTGEYRSIIDVPSSQLPQLKAEVRTFNAEHTIHIHLTQS